MPWRVLVPGAETRARLATLPPGAKKAIRGAFDAMGKDWPGPSLDVKALDMSPGQPPLYRVRVGDWRFAVEVAGQDLRVVHVFHRSEGYDWLERF